jgi:hypothetical protein
MVTSIYHRREHREASPQKMISVAGLAKEVLDKLCAECRRCDGLGTVETQKIKRNPRHPVSLDLVGGLEHGFYDFPFIGNNHPN